MASGYIPNIKILQNSNNIEMIYGVRKYNILIVSSFLDEGKVVAFKDDK